MLKKIATFAMLGLICTTPAHSQGMTGCYLYEKDDFRGAEFKMGANTSIADFGTRRGWNDEISSTWVTPNCRLTIWEHSRFRGGAVYVTFNIYSLKKMNDGFNDMTSSAKCECS